MKEEDHWDKEEITQLGKLLSGKEKDWLDKKTMHESDC